MKASVATIFEVFTELSHKSALASARGGFEPMVNKNLGEVAGILGECDLEIEIPENLQQIFETK